MHLDDSFHQRQADSRAIALRVELFEETENTLLVLGIDAHSVVGDTAQRFAVLVPDANVDPRRRLLPHELDGVLQQILEHLSQPMGIAKDGGQVGVDATLRRAA